MSGELTEVLNHWLSATDGSITSAQQEISVENSSQPIVVSPEGLTVVQQEVKPVSDNFVQNRIYQGPVILSEVLVGISVTSILLSAKLVPAKGLL